MEIGRFNLDPGFVSAVMIVFVIFMGVLVVRYWSQK
jgi:hypothetical protein